MESKYFLTDEFQKFSSQIKEVHNQKKEKKAKLKEIYDQFQEEFAELDQKAAALAQEWEDFVAKEEEKSNK